MDITKRLKILDFLLQEREVLEQKIISESLMTMRTRGVKKIKITQNPLKSDGETVYLKVDSSGKFVDFREFKPYCPEELYVQYSNILVGLEKYS